MSELQPDNATPVWIGTKKAVNEEELVRTKAVFPVVVNSLFVVQGVRVQPEELERLFSEGTTFL